MVVIKNKKTEAYKSINMILDSGAYALDNHNSMIYTRSRKGQDFIANGLFMYSNNTDMEFMKHPDYIDYEQCQLVCPLVGASIPNDKSIIKEAMRILDINNETNIWIQTEQTSQSRGNWAKEDMGNAYEYKVFFKNTQIYPTIVGSNKTGIQSCRAFKNGRYIQPHEIGYIHNWELRMHFIPNYGHQFKPRPFKLEAVVNKCMQCTIIVTNSPQTEDHILDDALCICTRKQSQMYKAYHKMKSNEILKKLETELGKLSELQNWSKIKRGE